MWQFCSNSNVSIRVLIVTIYIIRININDTSTCCHDVVSTPLSFAHVSVKLSTNCHHINTLSWRFVHIPSFIHVVVTLSVHIPIIYIRFRDVVCPCTSPSFTRALKHILFGILQCCGIFFNHFPRGWRVCHVVSLINSWRAKFFREKINIYLHFMLLLHIDMAQVLKILPEVRPIPIYSSQSILLLLMSWRRKEPGHQQPWYWPS